VSSIAEIIQLAVPTVLILGCIIRLSDFFGRFSAEKNLAANLDIGAGLRSKFDMEAIVISLSLTTFGNGGHGQVLSKVD